VPCRFLGAGFAVPVRVQVRWVPVGSWMQFYRSSTVYLVLVSSGWLRQLVVGWV
jgi:hypothetical protein